MSQESFDPQSSSINSMEAASMEAVTKALNSPNSQRSVDSANMEESFRASPVNPDSSHHMMGISAASITSTKTITNIKGRVTYTWKNLNVLAPITKKCCKGYGEGPMHKTILNDVLGCVNSGEIWAMMGASGAGKTTLLNTLNFRTTKALHVSGERCINGTPVGPEVISSISAYVQQDDLLFPRMTVEEHLTFCARLRLPAEMTKAERKTRVNDVLQELGLWNIRKNYIGSATTFKGISGGEKKRLAFASEILTDPNILFCDEPTSGLDSFMALTVVNIMKKMASRGKLIICTIHQPSSEVFNKFDNLYLLTEGRVAYAGPRADAVPFFSTLGYACPATHNPADYYLHQLAIKPDTADECRAKTGAIADAFARTDEYQRYAQITAKHERNVDVEIIEKQAKGRSVYRANNFVQMRALMWRAFICTIREPMVFGMKFIQHIALGFVIGIIFYRPAYDVEGAASICGALMMCVFVQMMLPMYAVICTFSDEIPIFLREHWNGMYRTWTYFLSRSIVDMPIYVIFPWLFFPQAFWLVGMTQPLTNVVFHCITLMLLALVSTSFGYLACCWTKNVKMVLQSLPLLLQPFMIFSGFFLDQKTVFPFIGWIKYASIIYYASENLVLVQWEAVEDVYQTEPFVPELFGDGPGVIDYYNYTPGRYNINTISMIVLFFVARILAYLGLWLKTKR